MTLDTLFKDCKRQRRSKSEFFLFSMHCGMQGQEDSSRNSGAAPAATPPTLSAIIMMDSGSQFNFGLGRELSSEPTQ